MVLNNHIVVIHLTKKKTLMFSMSCKHREAVYEVTTSEQAPALWQWAMVVRGKLLCPHKPRSNCFNTQCSFPLIVGHSKIAAVSLFNMKSENMEKFYRVTVFFNSLCGNLTQPTQVEIILSTCVL